MIQRVLNYSTLLPAARSWLSIHAAATRRHHSDSQFQCRANIQSTSAQRAALVSSDVAQQQARRAILIGRKEHVNRAQARFTLRIRQWRISKVCSARALRTFRAPRIANHTSPLTLRLPASADSAKVNAIASL